MSGDGSPNRPRAPIVYPVTGTPTRAVVARRSRLARTAPGAGIVALVAGLVLAVAPTPAPGSSAVPDSVSVPQVARTCGAGPASVRAGSVVVGGTPRRYVVALPDHHSGPLPLVVAFHGLGQSVALFARQSGLCAATRAAGEVLVLPVSDGPAFNDGRLGPAGPDDVALTLAVVDRLVAGHVADGHRVTVTGFSNGAGMAMAVAAAAPQRVAAVVAVDGEMIAGRGAYAPTGPVEAVLVHGTADRVQPDRGRRAGRSPLFPAYVSWQRTVAAWTAADGCGEPLPETLEAPDGPGATGSAELDRYPPGGESSRVTTYRVTGMHHRWPIMGDRAGRPGVQLAPFDAAQVVVATAATARAVRPGSSPPPAGATRAV